VVAAAKAERIALHLDGARLPIAAASAGRSCAEFCAPFDTVYLSLWKMLGLPWGAALAGPAALLDGIEHDRRRHGGGIPRFWPLAAMTLAGLEARLAEWPELLRRAEALHAALAAQPGFAVAAVEGERTNAFWLAAPGVEPAAFGAAARARGLALPDPVAGRFPLRANSSWLAHDVADLAARLAAARAAA
jgi:threonine aldolase